MSVFTPEQVDSLNGYQACGMFHPFTCGKCNALNRDLVATPDGWRCANPDCDYTQDWAHDFMANGSWRAAVEASPMHKIMAEIRGKQA